MTLSPPDARTKLVIAALTVAAFAIGLDTFVIIGALDVISRDLAISPGAAGSIISIYALCYAVFAPLNAWMFTAMSGHNVQILSVSIFIIGNVICAIAPNFLTVAAGRVIAAYGAAMFTPAATALAAELLPPARKGFALSLIFGGMTVSQVVGAPATSWIADAIGWRFSFGFVVIAGLLALVIFAPMMSGIAPKAPERGNGPISQGLSKSIYGMLSVTLFIVVSEFIVYSYVSVFITGSLLAGVPLLSAALFAYGFGAVTGNTACGVLTDRFGPYRVLIAVAGAQLILLVALVAFRQHGALTVLIAFFWGNASYMYLVPIQHRLLGLAGNRSKLVLAMNSSTTFAGIAIGAFLGGILVETSGVASLAAASLLIGLIGIGLTVAFMRNGAPAEAATAGCPR
ncbi:MFS transporter [Bradyrhizobium huanghuaihaiense]|uniref:MFS transporter n=1 Tax=Bradyrhizobium huanghuaihaiense TaxID=990078 RepID=UPI0021AA1326|nr:MFS transporter [Bradyrhizobium sp. CB3035]UWU75737.1 MFS transporter [Bradyrhizobium sp. CB3035]